MKETYRKIDCEISRVTDKAALVVIDGMEHWVPLSVCSNGHKVEDQVGETMTLLVAEWFANNHLD